VRVSDCGRAARVRLGTRKPSLSFHDFGFSRGVARAYPAHPKVTYSELMEGRLRDPVYRGIV